MLDAAAKVDRSVRGAATAMGCRAEIRTVPGFLSLRNDPLLAACFRDHAESLFGPGACQDLPHSGGSTDAGDLSQIMPVLHPNLTGARGQVHGPDWRIADPEAAYVAPAKILAAMAIDLLGDGAALARRVVADHRPAMGREEYLRRQKALFRRDSFDGGSA
jgi:metal-dependent amidase/aminoacylase/carboxypeptidase family protein